MNVSSTLTRTAADTAGAALGAVFGALGRIRPAAKPLHPEGIQLTGTLTRYGSARSWGVPWLDEPGTDRVLVRFSRAMGLPANVPDILGLTIRVQRAEGDADLLLATTGRGVVSRFVLVPRRDLDAGYGSLMAYRTPAGAVWLFARSDEDRIQLSVAGVSGDEFPFAEIELDPESEPADPTVSFDPVLNPLPGLEFYPWERRLRESAYAAARSSRS